MALHVLDLPQLDMHWTLVDVANSQIFLPVAILWASFAYRTCASLCRYRWRAGWVVPDVVLRDIWMDFAPPAYLGGSCTSL